MARLLADLSGPLTKSGRMQVSADVAKAKTRGSLKAFEKLTVMVDGHREFAPDPALVERTEDLLDDTNRDRPRRVRDVSDESVAPSRSGEHENA